MNAIAEGTKAYRPAAILMAVRLGTAALGIGVQIALARLLGAEQLGTFYLATALASVAAVAVAGGYPNIVLKTIGGSRGGRRRGDWLARTALGDGLVIVVPIALGFGVLATVMPDGAVLAIAALAVPVIALSRLLGAFGIARSHPLLANLPEMAIRPLVVGLGLAVVLLAGRGIGVAAAVGLFVAGAAVALAWLAVGLARAGAMPRLWAPTDRRVAGTLRRSAAPLAPVAGLTAYFGDVAIVAAGLALAPAALGVFAVSLKIGLFVGYGVQAFHVVAMPRIAAAFARSDNGQVGRILLHLNRTTVAATAVGAAALVLFADDVLALFGPEFVAGTTALVLVALAQVGRAFCGPSLQALALLGRQRTSGLLAVGTALLMAAGCVALAPSFGATGAAAATVAAFLFWYGFAAWRAAAGGLATAGLNMTAGGWNPLQSRGPA